MWVRLFHCKLMGHRWMLETIGTRSYLKQCERCGAMEVSRIQN